MASSGPVPAVVLPAHNPHAWILRLRPALAGSLVKRLLRVRRIEVQSNEAVMFVDPASNLGATLFRDGSYEPAMVRLLEEILAPGATFVDIGANEGWFSVIASRLVGPRGRVLAIEPQRRLQAVLAANLKANACANVEVIEGAAGAGEAQIDLYLMPSINTGASSTQRPTRYPLPTQRAACSTLTSLFQAHGVQHCDLVKIDVEGYEQEVLAGAEDLLTSSRIGAIALELHPTILARRGQSVAAIDGWLRKRGYAPTGHPATALYVASGGLQRTGSLPAGSSS